MNYLTGFFLLLVFTSQPFAQPPVMWENTIGGTSPDKGDRFIRLSNGNYIVAGNSSSGIGYDKTEANEGIQDYWVLYLDQSGTIIWDLSLGGTGQDWLVELFETADNNLFIAGYTSSNISGDITDDCPGAGFWILKIDLDGNIIWQNMIGSSLADKLRSVVQTPDGGFFLGGSADTGVPDEDKTEPGYGETDYWVIKTDSDGVVEWEKTYGGSGFEYIGSVEVANDGGYLISGASNSQISGLKTEDAIGFPGNFDNWIIRINSTGDIVWQNTIGGNQGDFAYCSAVLDNGNFAICGGSGSGISGDKTDTVFGPQEDVWIYELSDLDGEIVWQRTLGGYHFEKPLEVINSVNGGILIAIQTESGFTGTKTSPGFGAMDYWLVKLHDNGLDWWQTSMGGTGNDAIYSVIDYPDGGILLAGTSNSSNNPYKSENAIAGSNDIWVLKLGDYLNTGEQNSDPFISSVYPNPSNGLFTLNLPDQFETVSIRVFNSSGQCILSQKIQDSVTAFDLTNASKGIYLLRIESDSFVHYQKIVLN